MFSFLPLIHNSITLWLSFLLLSLANTTIFFSFFIGIVLRNIFINTIHVIRVLHQSFGIIKPVFSRLLINNLRCFLIDKFHQYLVGELLD